MNTSFQLGDIHVDVQKKNIKNIHLSVYPPMGGVRVSAPARMDTDLIRVFVIQKLGWIKKQQHKLQSQERESPSEYRNRESHFLWGKRYLMKVAESERANHITLNHCYITLHIKGQASEDKKSALLNDLYREELRTASQKLVDRWTKKTAVTLRKFYIQRMKTKWGSCSPQNNTIRLNLELAKKPPECLEYIVVHELLHLIEPTHNQRFIALLNHYMPKWQFYRDELNRLPIRQEKWKY